MRCASACRGRRSWPTGSTRTPRAASCWAGIARRPPRSDCCSSTARFRKTYWAVVEGGPTENEGTIDTAARPPERRARLVAEARSGRTAGRHQLERARPRRRPHLARDGAGHRPHASIARACRRHGLADRRRQHLRHRPALRRTDACICIRARSGCRFRRTRSRCARWRRRRSICTSGFRRAGGMGSDPQRQLSSPGLTG